MQCIIPVYSHFNKRESLLNIKTADFMRPYYESKIMIFQN